MIQNSETRGENPVTATTRRENISPLSVAVLLVMVAFQVLSQAPRFARYIYGARYARAMTRTGAADAEAFISIDLLAKAAYLSDIVPTMPKVKHADRAIHRAEDEAETELIKTPKDPGIARREILLRAEAGDPAPLSAIAGTKKRHSVPSPLGAFSTPDLAGERQVWTTLFSAQHLPSKTNVSGLARQVRRLTNIGWYGHLALHQLYVRAGNRAAAQAELTAAGTASWRTMGPTLLVYLGLFCAGLLGLSLLAYQLTRMRRGNSTPPPFEWSVALGAYTPKAGLWPPVAEPDGERKLGAGDLFDIFVLYMFFFLTTDLAITMGGLHIIHAHEAFVRAHQAEVEIYVAMFQQALTAVLAFGVLVAVVKARGSTLRREIWMRAGSLGANIGYGAAAWAMALPLVIVAGTLADAVFRKFPNPSNPGIFMLISAHGALLRLALFLMICVFAPFFEETMFRGVFFQAARARLGAWPAIVLTGVLFGGIHPVGVAGTVPLMVLGSFFAWVAEKRKSLLPGMVGHFLQNTASYVMLISLYS